MDNYKTTIKPIDLIFPKIDEMMIPDDQIEPDKILEFKEMICSNNSVMTKISFLKKCEDIYAIENTIPFIISTGLFDSIIQSPECLTKDIYDVLNSMLTTSFENTLLLFQSSAILILLFGIQSQESLIFNAALDCFANILNNDYDNLENELFILFLIISTNLIEPVFNRVQNLKSKEDQCINSIFNFLKYIYINIPKNQVDPNIYLQKFETFSMYSQIFHKQIFQNFIQNEILLTNESSLYRMFIQMLQIAEKIRNPWLICNICIIISCLVSNCKLSSTVFFNDLSILSYMESWTQITNPMINEYLSAVISSIFNNYEFINSLTKDHIQKLCSISVVIFDQLSVLNDEKRENEVINFLKSLLCFTKFSNIIIPHFLGESRKRSIIQKLFTSEYKLSRNYGYWILIIASLIPDYKQILNDEVLEKIFEFMDKLEGDFVKTSLFRFGLIFQKQQALGKKDIFNSFATLGGLEIIETMAYSNDERISEISNDILEHYFKENHN